jgi:hypothetical protein
MERGSLWVLLGHDGPFMEHTTRSYQGRRPGNWERSFSQTRGEFEACAVRIEMNGIS